MHQHDRRGFLPANTVTNSYVAFKIHFLEQAGGGVSYLQNNSKMDPTV